MRLSKIGKFTEEQLLRCNEIYPDISIPIFVVMPNHIHFIASISESKICNGYQQRTPNPALRANSTCQRHVPTLSKYISSLKGSVTKFAKSLGLNFA